LNLTTMSESDWETLSADPNAPAALINIVAALRRGEQTDQGRRYVRDGSQLLELELRQEDLDWAGQLGTTYGANLKTRGLHFVRPRFGQVQKQFVASLPAELDAAAHRDIVTQFGAELDTLGLPFTAALHRPNGYNHRANHHPHFIFYPAICRRGADGRFDLASGRKLRPGELAGWTKERRQSTFHQTSASADVVALTSVSSATWTGSSTSCHSTRTCSSRSAPMGSGCRSSHRSTGGPIVRLGLSEPQLMWFEPVAKHEPVNRYRNAGGAALLTPRLKLGFRSDLDAQCRRRLLCLLGFQRAPKHLP